MKTWKDCDKGLHRIEARRIAARTQPKPDPQDGKPEGWDDVPPPDQLAFGLIGLGTVADSARGLDAAGRVAAVIVAGSILAAHLDERPEDAEILRLAGAAINEALQDEDEPAPAEHCDWREDESGDFWNTCDEPWVFPDAGGPQENRMRFCPMCGKSLEFTPTTGYEL